MPIEASHEATSLSLRLTLFIARGDAFHASRDESPLDLLISTIARLARNEDVYNP